MNPTMTRTMDIGEVRVTFVSDGVVELNLSDWFPDSAAARWPTTPYRASIGLLLIESPDETLVVDAGLGDIRVPSEATAPPLGELSGGRAAGIVGEVVSRPVSLAITHAHEDHIGWLPEWKDAGLIQHLYVGEADRHRLEQLTGIHADTGLRGGEKIIDRVTAVPSPGHTAGHMSYLIQSGDDRALIFGDVFHHPSQISHPQFAAWSDEDSLQAAQSREQTLELLRDPSTTGIGYHFGSQMFGKVANDRWHSL